MSAPYKLPTSTDPIPHGLNLTQFIQTVLVGVSGIDGTLVRPEWQSAPPKAPDVFVDWIAFGIKNLVPDANGYLDVNEDEETVSQRHEELEIDCSLYGPNGITLAELIRDGFQIPQNRWGLQSANMDFTSVGAATNVPDLYNERWVGRVKMSVFLRREVRRVYPILTLVSASGKIHSVVGNEEYLLDWATNP